MHVSDELEDFKSLLRDLFQFDVADLDFGVYRILNEKRDEINQFIEEDLVEGVQHELEAFEDRKTEELRQAVEEAEKEVRESLSDDAIKPDGSVREEYQNLDVAEEYAEAREALADASLTAETKRRVYDDLTRFFRRYYDEGDFVAQRRFSGRDSTYYVPYDGEEVVLHWANRDQYYVKTTEHFRDYRFHTRGVDVHFKLVDADVPQDNVKAGDAQHFVLEGSSPIEAGAESEKCVIRFSYRPLTEEEEEHLRSLYNEATGSSRKTSDRKTIVRATAEQILDSIDDAGLLAKLQEPEDGADRGPLLRHLNRFTARHTADYFVHKDLEGFLQDQLDFFLQNEVLEARNLLDASDQRRDHQIGRAKAVEKIGDRIITFLAQIEDFQKRLFEKKKFVVDTGYCVTLDHVPDALYDTILDNDDQCDEWRELYAVEEWEGGLFTQGYEDGAFTPAFLETHPHAVIDTRHFDQEFEDRLLAHLSDGTDGGLTEAVDGLCVQGENFQALNLLEERFRNRVDCVYIDPPYNSQSTEILYKNAYKHSSWLSMMNDRLRAGRELLTNDGITIVAIDENEQERLGLLLRRAFPSRDQTCVTVEHNPRGIQGDNFSYTHEYAYFLFPREGRHIRQQQIDEEKWEYSNLRNWGGESRREDGRNCFYPIIVEDGEIVKLGDVPPDNFHPDRRVEETGSGKKNVWPIDRDGVERKWRYTADSLRDVIDTVRVREIRGNMEIEIARSRETPRTVWSGSRYDAGTHGSRLLSGMMGKENMPDDPVFPKSIHTVEDCLDVSIDTSESGHTVVDYFAGSGTTAHSLMRLDDEHGGDNSYVLVEMGDYFDTLLLPRLKKAAFSDNWKEGIPQDASGRSHIIQYHRLESYEDALNNIQLSSPEVQRSLTDQFEDYTLRYLLPTEAAGSQTLLQPDAFEQPFDYTLQIQHGMESPSAREVDLEATFNYLIGLDVNARRVYEHQDRRYVVVTGTVEKEQSIDTVMVVWRNQADLDLDAEKTWAADTLPDGPFDTVYVNGPSHIYGKAEPLDIEFRRRMTPAAG